jgi:hypothetical protein
MIGTSSAHPLYPMHVECSRDPTPLAARRPAPSVSPHIATRCRSSVLFCDASRDTRLRISSVSPPLSITPQLGTLRPRAHATTDSPVILEHVVRREPLQKPLVVRNHNQLKVRLSPAFADDPGASARLPVPGKSSFPVSHPVSRSLFASHPRPALHPRDRRTHSASASASALIFS